MKVSELYRKLHLVGQRGKHPFVDEEVGGGWLEPGEPVTQVTADDGGIGYSSPNNVPVIALRLDGDTDDRLAVWADGRVNGLAIANHAVNTFSRLGLLLTDGVPPDEVGDDGNWCLSLNGGIYFKVAGHWIVKV